jgi:hypothetical protein
MNLAACASLRAHTSPENSVWYRYILLGHLSTALSSAHTKKRPSRFNPGPLLSPPDQFATLSLAENPLVAQFEAGAMFGDATPGGHAPNPKLTFVSLNITVVLHDILDLTDVNSVKFRLVRTHRNSPETGKVITSRITSLLFPTLMVFCHLLKSWEWHSLLLV